MTLGNDMSRDFIHLSEAVALESSERILYQLITILEKCASNTEYKKDATENLIAYLNSNDKVRLTLQSIAHDSRPELESIQPLVKELNRSSQLK